MSAPTGERTWTREKLKALTRLGLQEIAKRFKTRANAKSADIIEQILKLQQSNLADAAPPPEPSPEQSHEPPPEPSPEPPEQSPERSHEPPPEPSPEPSPDLPEESRTAQRVPVFEDSGQVIASPRKAVSLGINPSQDSASTRSSHRSLGSNTSPRKDKGKSKETETADVEQLKGSSGEISSPTTNIVAQQTAVITSPPKMTKKLRRREKKQSTNPSRVAETSIPQSQEPHQTNDSQESQHRVQQIVLASDNSGSSLNLSNSNRTASSDLSWLHASLDIRLKKLESSASMESVLREQITDLHSEVETLKSDLEKVSNQLSEVQTRNSELHEENAKLREENTEIRNENAKLREENAEIRNENANQLSAFNDRLAMVEKLLKLKAPDWGASLTYLEGGSAQRLGSPQPIDEAKTPKPDTTPKAPPRQLEVTSTTEYTGARDSIAPFLLPAFSSPKGPPSPAEIQPPSPPGAQTPSGPRPPQPSSAPGSPHPPASTRKRNRDTLEEPERARPGPSVALGFSVPPPKRLKPNSATEEEEEEPTSFQRTGRGGERVRGGFITPPNPQPVNTPSTPVLVSRPDYPFNRGSPSPQRQLLRTPANGNLRHRVPSPARRPGTNSSAQPIIPLVVTPGAPVQVVAVPVRGSDTRRTPEATSSRAGPNHMVASSTLASAVGGVFNPPSSSTPARPAPSSLSMRTSAATSRPASGPQPHDRLALASRFPLPPISAEGPSAEGHDSGGSQNSSRSNSSGAERANQPPAPVPTEIVADPATPVGVVDRQDLGMPLTPTSQALGALDPFRFPGALQRVAGRANPAPNRTTPERSVRQMAPETPMASSTRYGTEINHSMRNLY